MGQVKYILTRKDLLSHYNDLTKSLYISTLILSDIATYYLAIAT